ncbi:hydantoinase/oxoprolinase family protein [Chloroflexi bacterium TSY]|nr:hydantoinase/oxoprolinase family protein [Chloroflexi bacterium TSY]
MAYRLGIDIGGTFTDATLINETTGEIRISKVASTPEDPSLGFMAATDRILRENGVAPADVIYLVHGTTVATNAIIEGKVARTGFITTEGFRDMLEIARQTRPSLYDLQFEKPKPLVPRYLCFGVPERLDARGDVLAPLDEARVREIATQLRSEGVEAIAVCLLHAYANPVHEERVGVILQELFPEAMLSLSSEVTPEFREYFRASTTVINASIRPVVARYLARIEERLRVAGVTAELLLMQSSGGVFAFSEASHKPVFMVESGPAAGVISAAYLGNTLGHGDIISFDMGGTTAKVGLIQGGTPKVTKDYEVGAAARAGVGAQRGAGYPIRTPVIDLVEIGAGGGSIAWVDSGGSLRVGPQSAGASPGPVCYGKGGTEPTITDANLVLGRLSPNYFLGGEIELDMAGARQAIQTRCAEPLGLDVVETAHGIIEIANAAMVNALRLVSVQRGYDPREFALVAFGGAGPVHANRLAAETEMPTVIIPMSPGTTSALGLLVTDLKHDYSTTYIKRLDINHIDQLDIATVEQTYQVLEEEGRAALAREGIAPTAMQFQRQVEMRYVGQSYELTVPLPHRELTIDQIEPLLEQFYQAHDQAYGFSAPGEPVEFVNLRLTAIGQIVKPQMRQLTQENRALASGSDVAQKAVRAVYFSESSGYVECPIYNRYQLAAGHRLVGPAIVEELDSTTVIHPGYQADVDRFGNLVLTTILCPV